MSASGLRPCRIVRAPDRRIVLSADAPARRRSLRWGVVLRSALRSLWREPCVEAPDGVARWDELLVAVLLPAALLEGLLGTDVPWPPFSIATAMVCVVAIWWRRSRPLAATLVAFGAQTLSGVAPHLAGLDYGVLYVTSCVLLFPYSLARWGSGRAVVGGMAFVLACHFGREPLYGSSTFDLVLGAGFLTLPAAIGASVRFRSVGRQREADQVRSLEREQLARELHDTVAHHVSAIAVQAQAGRAIAASDPERVLGVLEAIEAEASRSLAEMRAMVAILRTGEEASTAPRSGVADLPRLASSGGALPVALAVDLEPGELAPAVDAAVYRLVQESVTNAQRHARHATHVSVSVAERDGEVHVEVADDGRGPARRGDGGFGLAGMAERVALLGGRFAAGPASGGGWRVRAVLPSGGSTR